MKRNTQPVTRCGEGDIAPYVFLCGDPARVPKIAASWNGVREVCRVREYLIVTGFRDDVPLTAASTGIGGPSTAVVFEELAKLGAHTFIRVGNSGGLAEDIRIGEYVITTGAVRDDGTSRSYVMPEYPAVAHYEVVSALVHAAANAGVRFHTGITWSLDGFYARNKVLGPDRTLVSMSYRGYAQHGMNALVEDLKRAGVKNCEMESSAVLTLASLFGLRAGCICTVSDLTPWPGPSGESLDLDRNMAQGIDIALRAMLDLAKKPARE
jgi:uridine phosphorylase